MQSTARKPTTVLSLAAWEKVQMLYERGERIKELAKSFAVNERTITQRALKYGWRNPRKEGRRETGKRGVSVSEKPAATGKPGLLQSVCINLDVADAQNLQQGFSKLPSALPYALSESPEAFQDQVARFAESLMIQGSASIEPPKSIAEFKILNEVFRKAKGLDQKAKDAGPAGLVRPMRTLSRRTTQIVELDEEIDVERMLG
jgi:hypothetical protein